VTPQWLTAVLDGARVTDVHAEQIALDNRRDRRSGGVLMIFRVVDGRITEVWNCGYKQGVWQ
jgi:predicted SnoaL-like aldol condensation-catalyzing enzyme